MSKELMQISNGTFIMEETEDPNIFYFFRKDEEPLGDVGRLPMDFYQHYMLQKMFSGEITSIVMNNLEFLKSTDDKMMRIRVIPIGEDSNLETELKRSEDVVIKREVESKETFWQRIFRKIFC